MTVDVDVTPARASRDADDAATAPVGRGAGGRGATTIVDAEPIGARDDDRTGVSERGGAGGGSGRVRARGVVALGRVVVVLGTRGRARARGERGERGVRRGMGGRRERARAGRGDVSE